MWIIGLRIELLDLTFLFSHIDLLQLPIFLNYIITIVWIAGITNAINWLDGMDGLGAGVAASLAADEGAPYSKLREEARASTASSRLIKQVTHNVVRNPSSSNR